MVDTDRAWEEVARSDPYWGVLTNDEFLGATLDADAREAFFASGQRHVEHVLDVLRTRVQPGFAPTSALDYGCGVGRLVLPLAGIADRVVAVDISDSMLARTAEHLSEAGYTGVELIKPDQVSSIAPVELIHSTIVLQHIQTKRGMEIVRGLLDVLKPGGCGSLQFHLRGAGGPITRLSRRALENSQTLTNVAVRVLRRPSREALVLMHPYDPTAILRMLAGAGVTEVFVETDARADGYTDATFYFRKPEQLG